MSPGSPLSMRCPQDKNEAPTVVMRAAHGGLESEEKDNHKSFKGGTPHEDGFGRIF